MNGLSRRHGGTEEDGPRKGAKGAERYIDQGRTAGANAVITLLVLAVIAGALTCMLSGCAVTGIQASYEDQKGRTYSGGVTLDPEQTRKDFKRVVPAKFQRESSTPRNGGGSNSEALRPSGNKDEPDSSAICADGRERRTHNNALLVSSNRTPSAPSATPDASKVGRVSQPYVSSSRPLFYDKHLWDLATEVQAEPERPAFYDKHLSREDAL